MQVYIGYFFLIRLIRHLTGWVLTAAHCCWDPYVFYHLRAGLIAPHEKNDWEQERDVLLKWQHPDYGFPNSFSNDICLLKVDNHWTFNENVSAAILPPQGQEIAENTTLTVSGWGVTRVSITRTACTQTDRGFYDRTGE